LTICVGKDLFCRLETDERHAAVCEEVHAMKNHTFNRGLVKSTRFNYYSIIPLTVAAFLLEAGNARGMVVVDGGFQDDNTLDAVAPIPLTGIGLYGYQSPGFSSGDWTQIGNTDPFNPSLTDTALNNSGVWDPSLLNIGGVKGLTLLGGYNNVAYVDSFAAIQNNTGQTLSPETVYTLTGYVGNTSILGLGLNDFTGDVTVELLAGTTVVASGQVQAPGLINGVLGVLSPEFELNYTTGATAPAGDLSIELEGPGFNGDVLNVADLDTQVIYDDIGLTTSSVVPEKENQALAAFGLLFLGGTVGRKMINSRKKANA